MKITAYDALARENPRIMAANYVIEFDVGSGMIAVTLHHDGYIEVRASRGTALGVEPRTASSIWVSVKTS